MMGLCPPLVAAGWRVRGRQARLVARVVCLAPRRCGLERARWGGACEPRGVGGHGEVGGVPARQLGGGRAGPTRSHAVRPLEGGM